MLPSDIRYAHRVGPLHWLFVIDYGPVLRPKKYHLRYASLTRTFTAYEVRSKLPIAGWSDTNVLGDCETAMLRSLLPVDQLAACAAASLRTTDADS